VILDDDESIVEVLGDEIRRRGGRCLGFKQKEEFLGRVEELKPDLVLTDIMSPGLDGLSFLRRLRKSRTYAQIPVIVVSGSLDVAVEEEARRLGAFAWFPKPFAVDRMFETIAEALRTRYRAVPGAS
jgi:DNA-binding NtrC family response regulator